MKQFIEANRQKGSSTELVWAAIRADGFLVVYNEQSKQSFLKKFSALNPQNVFTMAEVKNGKWKGRESRPIFVDVACMYWQAPEDPIMNLSLKELVKRAKALNDVPEDKEEQ